MKIAKKAAPGQQFTMEDIRKMQTGNVKRGGIGCTVFLFLCGGIWMMAGVSSLFIGSALNFFVGLFIIALAAGALFLGYVFHRNRKQRVSVDVRLAVQECRCVDFWYDNDGESPSLHAVFRNTAMSQWETIIPESEQKLLKDREGFLVLDVAHNEMVMFFPKDLWQQTDRGFAAR